MLHAIRTRYERQEIYTYSGIVLIAVNPFTKVPLYTDAFIQQYSGKLKTDVQPHLFGIAEDAYRCMRREGKNQTIIVSGESGAGKTVSAKYIMRYFATVEDPDKPRSRRTATGGRSDGMSKTEEQIIATNPIMEAFGNAKTTRNDNSSRFGKYIEIMFDKDADIIGARIRTYLLERSRLNSQAPTERNYHIFYQLCAGLSPEEKDKLDIGDCMDFRYLNQGGDPVIPGVDDAREFQELTKALNTIGIGNDVQSELWKILAALLHLGNVNITASRDTAVLDYSDRHLKKASELLGVDSTYFGKWIIKQSRKLMKETIESPRTLREALVVRDSITKYIYNSVFEWLVMSINKTLATEEVLAKVKNFIGVLDIYGFEHFQTNSFEQFCINYANEKLQQEFTSHVFKLEQDEYIKEEIPWQMIDFADNQACISMIEDRASGILSMLDEQSKLGAGSDEAFRQTLVDKLKSNPQFDAPKLKKSSFTVKHYALPVTYESEGFLEKNRDTVSEQHLEALSTSQNDFLRSVVVSIESAAVDVSRKPGTVVRKPTLGSIFKSSLIKLMETIDGTNAHYIRCIKPNEAKKAWNFEPTMVLGQLTACGVLETIRISCAGYPSRWTFLELVERYYSLIPSSQWEQLENHRKMSQLILEQCITQETAYQVGKSKIFFKPGVLAKLENARLTRLNACATTIQRTVKGWTTRTQYQRLKQTVVHCQALARSAVARKQLHSLQLQRVHAISVQRYAKGRLIRQRYEYDRRTSAVTKIQAITRGFLARRSSRQKNWAAVVVQKRYRGNKGRRLAGQAKKDRGTVEAFKQKTFGLEQKVMSQAQDIQKHKADLLELQAQIGLLQSQLKDTEQRSIEHKSRAVNLESKLSDSESTATENRRQLKLQTDSMESRLKDYEAQVARLNKESSELHDSLRSRQQRLEQALSHVEEERRDKLSLQHLVNQLQTDIQRMSLGNTNGVGERHLQSSSSNGLLSAARGRALTRPGLSTSSDAPASNTSLDEIISKPNNGPYQPESVSEQIMSILEDDDLMNNEIMYGMIQSLKIPTPSLQDPPSEQDVLFPAHLINLIVSEMWKFGFIKESERFLANVMQSIQQQVMSYEGEDAIIPGAFWLSNVHEILSFVWLAEGDILNTENTDMGAIEWQDYDRLISIVKHDLESLEFNIYHTWMKELKKRLSKMIIHAVIESQSLPGFITSESSRFFNKLLQGNTPTVTMDDLLNHFNKVFKAMKSFYLEPSVIVQTMTELLKLVGVTAFNDLLMRRNFLSWKRGLQINYNITRVEEWCKSHELPEGTLQLEHLMQATKLLQLKKATIADIDILYDICWCLSNRQIHKLINQYYPADYENPLSPEILKAVASRVTPEETTEILLDAVALDDSGSFEIADAREIKLTAPQVPKYLSLIRIKLLLNLVEEENRTISSPMAIENGSSFGADSI